MEILDIDILMTEYCPCAISFHVNFGEFWIEDMYIQGKQIYVCICYWILFIFLLFLFSANMGNIKGNLIFDIYIYI